MDYMMEYNEDGSEYMYCDENGETPVAFWETIGIQCMIQVVLSGHLAIIFDDYDDDDDDDYDDAFTVAYENASGCYDEDGLYLWPSN